MLNYYLNGVKLPLVYFWQRYAFLLKLRVKNSNFNAGIIMDLHRVNNVRSLIAKHQLITIFAGRYINIMAHHHKEEEKKYDYMYYLVALVCGLITGAILEVGFIWIPVGGVLGLLTAAFFLNVLVKGREEA